MGPSAPASVAPFSDAELVAQTLAGSRDAFAEIVARYQTLVCSVTYSASGSLTLSQDLAQETFLTAWQRLRDLREPGSLRSWLCGIARNLNLRTHRDQLREPAHAAEPLDAAHDTPADDAPVADQTISREEEGILWRSIERIPETYREPLVLFYRQHHSIERVAALLEISEDTARQRLSRGRKLLHEEVASFVEGALRQSTPNAAFCASVMAALPLHAGLATATAAATKSAAVTSWISLSIAGLFASLLGSLGLVRLAPTPRVRRFTVRLLLAMWLDCLLLWIALPTTLALQKKYAWPDSTFALAQVACYFIWAAIMATLLIVTYRGFVALHREIAPPGSPLRVLPPSTSVILIAALMTTGSLAWLVQLTWLARDFVSLAIALATGLATFTWTLWTPALLARSGHDTSAYAWMPAALIATVVLALINLRLDLWLALLRGTDLPGAHDFLPMAVVHAATAIFVLWVAFVIFFTRPTPASRPSALMKSSLALSLVVLLAPTAFAAVDLSPEKWGDEERTRVETLGLLPTPPAARTIDAKFGIVSATMSPVAVRAGQEALRQGGTAADAAATVALTQIATALGSYVSYAGLMQLTYFDAKSGEVHSMNAGWNTYRGETEPSTIPTADQPDAAQGRKTMVPGFMAGLESMHRRFGTLPFAELFAPAIWYSENGVTLSPVHASFFAMRQSHLARTAEGRAFLHQAAPDRLPAAGDRFVQAGLAKTLRAVAQHGAQHMYTGEWGQAFVAAVQREGGKVTLDDLAAYTPTWEAPLATTFADHTVYSAGRSSEGGYQILQTLNFLEALHTSARGPYWRDADTLLDLSRVLQFAAAGPYVHNTVAAMASASGATLTLDDRATPAYANAALPLLDAVFNPAAQASAPKHSDAIVVIDRHGNVAALVHTINAVVWGSTGIVVDGVPLSDAASFQQPRLATLEPGARVPNEMAPLIALKDGQPTLAIACIGSSLVPETARLALGILGQHLDAATVMAAPPLILNFDFTKSATIVVPENGYDEGLLAALREKGVTIETKPQQEVWNLKGTAVLGLIDANADTANATPTRHTVENPAIFSAAAGD